MASRPADVEDLAQEGWLEMWRRLQTNDPTKAPLDYYLKVHARWRMLNVIASRQYQDRRHTFETSPDELPEEPFYPEYPADYIELREAVRALSPKQRDYVFRRFWLDYSTQEMVEHFGYNATSGLWWDPRRNQGARKWLLKTLLTSKTSESGSTL